MTTTQNLTAAAKRDLAKVQAGERVALRYGPFVQLLEAGYIEGTQDNYRLTDTVTVACRLCGGDTIPPMPGHPEEEDHYCESCGTTTRKGTDL